MSGRLLLWFRLCCIFAFLSVLLSNRASAAFLSHYLSSAGTIVSSAAESVYPAILPTLFAPGLPQNSRLPELPAGVITDPLDISEPSENILPGNDVLSLHIEEPCGHPLAIAVSRQPGNKVHIHSERRGEASPSPHDRIFLLPGTGQPAQILEVTAQELEVYEVPEDYDHLLNDMMPKPPGLVMVYRNREGEWIIIVNDPEGTWEMSLEEYRQGMSLLFESLLSLEFSELPFFTLGLDTASARAAPPRKQKKETRTNTLAPGEAGLPRESVDRSGSATNIPGAAENEAQVKAKITTDEQQQINPAQVCRDFKMLDQLHRFISPQELEKLTRVANDNSHRETLEQLKQGGYLSRLYFTADTCNTLYWGLMNRELTEVQFLENYHYLTLRLMLVPEGTPFPESPALQGFSQRVAKFEVISPDPDTELTWENLSDASYVITMAQEQKNYISQFNDHPKPESLPVVDPEVRVQHLWYWMRIFPTGSGCLQHRYQIGSVSAIKRDFEARACENEKVIMKPGFGGGDWDALKVLRLQDQHPVALWHPDLYSLEQPDGFWIGALPHLHDFIHLNVISDLPRRFRHEALTLDTFAIMPAIVFLQHFIRGQLTDQDHLFLSIFKEQEEFLAKKSTQPAGEAELDIDTAKTKLQKLNERRLLDQPFLSLSEYSKEVMGGFYSHNCILNTELIDRVLHNLFIFTLVSGNHQEFTKQFFKVELKEHAFARREVDELNPQPSDILTEICYLPDDIIKKWSIDWWIRKLNH